jgi:hypothetical protein
MFHSKAGGGILRHSWRSMLHPHAGKKSRIEVKWNQEEDWLNIETSVWNFLYATERRKTPLRCDA